MNLELSANLIFVKDVKAAVQFYRDILGMKLVAERVHYTEYQLGPATFLVESANVAERAPGFQETRVGGRTGIVFKVEDVKKAVEDLRGRGARIAVEPVHHRWGWNAVFADPDGNEFILEE